MPSTFVPLPVPIVPIVPGVPPLLTVLAGAVASVLQPLVTFPTSLITGDNPTPFPLPFATSQWGIFSTGGSPIIEVDSVNDIEYSRDYRISDYPQEQGAFMSYNKVQVPYQAKVSFLVAQSRYNFLNEIETQLASLQFVSVVTPEISYPQGNLTHYDFRRTSKSGISMIKVTVWVEEVRIVSSAALSNAQGNNQQTTQDGGVVQPEDTTGAPTNPATGNLTTGLTPPNANSNVTNTNLTTPQIGPAFYNSDNLPEVPNTASSLSPAQQSSTINLGSNLGASSGTVSPTDTNGNTYVIFPGTF